MYQSWDLAKFINTLGYFEVIPWLSNLIEIFTGDSLPKSSYQPMPTLFFTGNNTDLHQSLTPYLEAQGWQILPNPTPGLSAIIYAGAPPTDSELDKLKGLIESNGGIKTLFDFTQPTPPPALKECWGVVDDVVMGGVSQSNLVFASQKALFTGVVSTANNGGFASVRTRNFNPVWDLSEYQGIDLKVQGDGKRYKLILRCDGQWDGISYCYSFDTVYDYPLTIKVPFAELKPVVRAKTVPNAGKFDNSKLYAMQLMLSKFEYDGNLNPYFEPGSFCLEVKQINAYQQQLSSPQLVIIAPQLVGKNLNYQGIDSNLSLPDIITSLKQKIG